MKIAIVGFSGSGKSTVFNAITGHFSKEGSRFDPSKTFIDKINIPDERLEKIATIFKPKKITHAELNFSDLPSFNLAQAKEYEALAHVVGVFSEKDYKKDIENMDVECIISDLAIIEKRLPRLEKEIASSPSNEKDLEKKSLLKCKDTLDKNTPLRDIDLTKEELHVLSGYQFLTRKPIFIIANIEESQINSNIEKEVNEFCSKKKLKCASFCAKIEAEIQALDNKEKEEFSKSLGLKDKAPNVVARVAYEALGFITFFTTKRDELKAWLLPKNETAYEAAGKIHTDIKKGFIKAEVVNFNDLVTCGSLNGTKNKGLVKLEGKEYIVKDADIIDFKFNV